MSSTIRYAKLENFAGWDRAQVAIRELLREFPSRRILEIGAGANPTLSVETIRSESLEYTTNDVSQSELAKAATGYQRLLLDVGGESIPPHVVGHFDFVFSRMVNEHVSEGERYYRNIFQMLRPGGVSAHWFSTLYALPFLANRALPEWLGNTMLNTFAPRDRDRHEKFRAYYSWGRGQGHRI
jgi:2-polyprenyl-3-methyl-5-hydroxy-6-metoxy-1,4-benzoquinol methylase